MRGIFMFVAVAHGWSVLFVCLSQYPMDRTKGIKVPVQIRVNMWLGLSAHEKKFNSFSEGTFSVFAELVC